MARDLISTHLTSPLSLRTPLFLLSLPPFLLEPLLSQFLEASARPDSLTYIFTHSHTYSLTLILTICNSYLPPLHPPSSSPTHTIISLPLSLIVSVCMSCLSFMPYLTLLSTPSSFFEEGLLKHYTLRVQDSQASGTSYAQFRERDAVFRLARSNNRTQWCPLGQDKPKGAKIFPEYFCPIPC